MCRIWLRDSYIKEAFGKALQELLSRDVARDLGRTPSVTDIIVFILSNIGRSNAILTANELTTEDRRLFWPTLMTGRTSFQKLCEAAILATAMNARGNQRSTRLQPRSQHLRAASRQSRAAFRQPRAASQQSRATSQQSRASSQATSVADSQVAVGDDPSTNITSKKERDYQQFKTVPNVHVGHHYNDVMERYGLVSLLMVFAGEQKHK